MSRDVDQLVCCLHQFYIDAEPPTAVRSERMFNLMHLGGAKVASSFVSPPSSGKSSLRMGVAGLDRLVPDMGRES